MPSQKLVVGPINKGLRNDLTAFNVDNDSFPSLTNAYQWRGRIKRKRGTEKLSRLQRNLFSVALGNTDGSGALSVNIITLSTIESTATVVPGSVTITIGAQTFTDNSLGVLTNNGTINYATGAITLQTNPVLAATAATVTYAYYPVLPVMGLEDLLLDPSSDTLCLGFDTTYSYYIPITTPYTTYSVSFYKNTSAPTTKAASTAVKWNGQNYQQFWTVNYQGALWATNGITDPYSTTNIGMQFSGVTNVAAPVGQTVVITVTGSNLVVGDWVFLNEFNTAIVTGVNFQAGYVSAGSAPGAITITLPNATLGGGGGATTSGIVQYLTNSSDVTKDCIRWYDGDPTTGVSPYPSSATGKGWVNFCPPLLSASTNTFTISDLPTGQYYLVGARMIIPFKDRLLFLGPVVQTSTTAPKYLQDTIIYSQNGVPYYTASFSGTASPTTTYNPILVPDNQTAQPSSFWEDQIGYGGYIQFGGQSPITTVSVNEDVLIIGFKNKQARLVYTGNDLVPFNFYVINSELGSESTFSSINLDRGVIAVGGRGIILTSQTASQRIDLEIPDEIFQFSLVTQGSQRVCAYRDYINEWIVFTYRSNEQDATIYPYPTQSLIYNYRDSSWGIFYETYTTYGIIRLKTGGSWSSLPYSSWDEWQDPWNSGESNLLQPEGIGGNAQGYVMLLSEGTTEGASGSIASFSGSTVTSYGHCLNPGDFIIITGCLGTISSSVNGKVFKIISVPTANTFVLDLTPTGTYTGLGEFIRLYVPFIQTKQFPVAWDMGRKTRIGTQQYLLSTTSQGQITLLIYLSQNGTSPYNFPQDSNDSLVYTSVLYTCPESTNLGLTAANTNLQMLTGPQQDQIWHRVNTSLIGDTVQLGFTISDEQMLTLTESLNTFAITGATQANPCVLTCTGQFPVGELIKITGVLGMTQLNFNSNTRNYYYVLASGATTVTIDVNSTSFGAYTSGGTAVQCSPVNQFSEVELHGIILDVTPSQSLS